MISEKTLEKYDGEYEPKQVGFREPDDNDFFSPRSGGGYPSKTGNPSGKGRWND